MAFEHFLAMTSAEYGAAARLPRRLAWMACHFSPDHSGLCDLPEQLPQDSILILNDRLPIAGHDRQRILEQLSEVVRKFRCRGLLLDFQRGGVLALADLADTLFHALPCPVCVTPEYAPEGCPVFLPPIPVQQKIEDCLVPWKGREIWLESALNGCEIRLTPRGAEYDTLTEAAALPFFEEKLLCHYGIEIAKGFVRFSLLRTPEDLGLLLKKAEELGVTAAVGLYQELGDFPDWT